MSGVYIKGMEMPFCCGECPFEHGTYCMVKPAMKVNLAKRDKNCPLIPVHDHGDLIERDSLPWYLKDVTEILEAPTIIPADEEDGE